MNVCACILVTAVLAGSLAASHVLADLTYTNFYGPAPNLNGTLVSGINNNGNVDGVTVDANFNHQGFNGTPPGSFTTFVLPAGSSAAPNQTILGGMNDSNLVVGFTPGATGNFTLVQFPGASMTAGVVGVNGRGTIVGNYLDASGVEHCFIGTP